MIGIGLTGGIGSGKTVVSKVFATLGIPVFYADLEAKKIQDHDPDIREFLTGKFGNEIYLPHGLDRPRLADILFNNPDVLQKLNGILHPKVAAKYHEWYHLQKHVPFVLHEAAIIFEAEFQHFFDKIILVTAPEETRIERIMQRDHISSENIKARMKHQWPDEKKRTLSDYIINNDGIHAVIPQVLKIYKELKNQ